MRYLVVGQARSGTTALYSLILQSLESPTGYFEERISEIPALPPRAVVKVILEHETPEALSAYATEFDRRIILVRDPRDNIVSRMLFFASSSRIVVGNDDFITKYIKVLKAKQVDPGSISMEEILYTVNVVRKSFMETSIQFNHRCAEFIKHIGTDWFKLRYEDLVKGNISKLSPYLELSLTGAIEVEKAYDVVGRTKQAGDWRNWFTASDVALYRPMLDPLLVGLGYEPDWELPAQPEILPEHSWRYLATNVRRRRAHFGFPPLVEAEDAPTSSPSTKNRQPRGLERLQEELSQSRLAGVPVRMWWRDDDLIANSRGFEALVRVARTYSAPVLVSIIAGLASEALDIADADPSMIHFCQHGWRHINHLPEGAEKSEFGFDRDPLAIEAEIAAGQVVLARLLGDRCLPIFVPPWNAYDDRHLGILRARGFTGLSTHGPRAGSFAAPGLRLANTHLDVLRWDAEAGPRALPVDVATEKLAMIVRDQRLNPADDPEPIGLLSHHRAMGDDAWSLLETLMATLCDDPGVSWLAAPDVFAPPS